LLQASGGKLDLAATDMELSLRTSMEAQVETEGSVVVPGRLLLELARLLPDAEVSIEHKPEEAAVEIRSGSASYRLHTYNAEDFPRLPDADAVDRHDVDCESQPLRVAGRVAPGADRRADALRAGEARDGRDRFVPPLGEGDGCRGHRA
jgi:hypothetical protein